MPPLAQIIKEAIADGRYVLSVHATERLRERRVMEWQVAAGTERARLFHEKPTARPNPSVELLQELADGSQIKAVWAWLPGSRLARLVTVHFMDS